MHLIIIGTLMYFKKASLMVVCALFITITNSSHSLCMVQKHHSAGVVPLFRYNQGRGKIGYLLFTPTHVNINNPSSWDQLLFSDLSSLRQGNEDPATTAARAFYSQQSAYHSINSLANALRRYGKAFDMGNKHITYFFPIQDRFLPLFRLSSCISGGAMAGIWENLFQTIQYAQEHISTTEGKGVKAHDKDGCLWTLFDEFVKGLVRNEHQLKNLRLEGLEKRR